MTETTEIEHALESGQVPPAGKRRASLRREDRSAPASGQAYGAAQPRPESAPPDARVEAGLLALLAAMGC